MLKPIHLDGLEAATEIALSFLSLPPLQRECMRYYAKGMMDAEAIRRKEQKEPTVDNKTA